MSLVMKTGSIRAIVLAGVAALALGVGGVAATTPAQAFGGHGGGFGGGGAMFHPSYGGGGRGFAGRGGFGGGRGGYALGALGLGLAAGGLIGGGYAYNDGYGADGECLRAVQTPYGYRTVDVCD